MARGHKINGIKEVPLVVSAESLATVEKTKAAKEVFENIGLGEELERVAESKKLRAGKGKMRNRRYVQRRGPLVVYKEKNAFTRACRNIPGVTLCKVTRLNLLKLAPGAHVGRIVLWTSDAFAALDGIFGTYSQAKPVAGKRGFMLPYPKMAVTDLSKLLHSEAVEKVLAKGKKPAKRAYHHKNALTNVRVLARLNPYAIAARRHKMVMAKKNAEAPAKKVRKVDVEAKKKLAAAKKAFTKALLA